MFAVLPFSPVVGVSICVALGIVGAFVTAGVGYYVYRKIKNRKAGASAPSSVLPNVLSFGKSLASSPAGKEVETVVATAFDKMVKVAIHAAAAKYVPHLAPLITKPLDQLVDEELAKVTGQPVTTGDVKEPQSDPVLPLLHDIRNALRAKIEPQQSAPAAKP